MRLIYKEVGTDMQEKTVLDGVLNALTALVGQFQDKTSIDNLKNAALPPYIEVDLEFLELQLGIFVQATATAIRETEIEQSSIEQKKKEVIRQPAHDKTDLNLQKIEKLKRSVEEMQGKYEKMILQLKEAGLKKGKMGSNKDQTKERMKKFNKTGAKKGWTPL